MLLWLKSIENFLSEYPHIVSAFGALSTFAAVVVSLMIALWAQRTNRTKLTARIYVADIVLQGVEPENSPQYITVSITNTGTMPLRIPFSFLYWKMPFQWRIVHLVVPLDSFGGDRHIRQRSYPVSIEPRSNERFYVGTPELVRESMVEKWQKYRWRLYFLRRFIRFMVETEDGYRYKATMSVELRRIMAEKPEGF
jgi:hypothetical protein